MTRTDRVFSVLRWVVLVLWLAIIAFPLYWTLSTSFKPSDEWVTTPIHWIPESWTLENYKQILIPNYVAEGQNLMVPTSTGAISAIGDSAIVAVGGTLLALILGLSSSYAISRYKFGGDTLPFSILNVRMFPPIAALIPLLVMFSTIRLVDSYWVLILVNGVFAAPFAVWLTKGFIDDVPRELEEAARIDGMSELGAAVKIVLPTIAGGLATTALFVFIVIWSDFVIAFTLAGQNVVTIPVRLQLLNTATAGALYGPKAALGIIAAIPVVIFGIAIQKYLARGLTFGAIKQ